MKFSTLIIFATIGLVASQDDEEEEEKDEDATAGDDYKECSSADDCGDDEACGGWNLVETDTSHADYDEAKHNEYLEVIDKRYCGSKEDCFYESDKGE